MSNKHDSEEDVFEDIADEQEKNTSAFQQPDLMLNSRNESSSKVLSPSELKNMEIKFEQAEKKTSSFRQMIEAMHRSTIEETDQLRTEIKLSKKHASGIIAGDERMKTSKISGEIPVQTSIRKKFQMQSSINMQTPDIDSSPSMIDNYSDDVMFGKKSQECIEKQKTIDLLRKQQNESNNQILRLKQLLYQASQKEKDLEAQISFIQGNSSSVSRSDTFSPFIRPTISSQITVMPCQSIPLEAKDFAEQIKPQPTKQNQNDYLDSEKIQQYELKIRQLSEALQNSNNQVSELSIYKENSQIQILKLKKTIQENTELITEYNAEFSDLKTKNEKLSTLFVQNSGNIESLNENLNLLKLEMTKKDFQLKEKDVKFTEIQSNIQKMCQQLIEKDKQIKQKDEKIRIRDVYISQRDELLQAKQEKINEIKKKMNQKDENIKITQEQFRKKEEEIIKERDELIKIQERQFKREPQNQTNQIGQKQQQIKEKDQIIRKREQQISQKEQQIKARDEKIKRRDEFISEKEKQIKENEDTIMEKQTKIIQLSERLRFQETERETNNQSELSTLISENSELTEKIIQIQQSEQKLKNQLISEKLSKSSLLKEFTSNIDQMENELKFLRNQLQQMNETNRRIQIESQDKVNLDSHEQVVSELKQVKIQSQNLIIQLKAEKSLRQKEENKRKQTEFNMNKQKQTLLKTYQSLESQIISLKQQNKQLHKSKLASNLIQSEIGSLRQQIFIIRQQSQSKDSQLQDLMEKLSIAQRNIKNSELQGISLKKQAELQKTQSDTFARRISELSNEIVGLKAKANQIERLENQLKALKNPKTIKEKFQLIKGWFELKENANKYEFQSRPVSKARENIELMNWLEEYFRVVVSEAVINQMEDNL